MPRKAQSYEDMMTKLENIVDEMDKNICRWKTV